MYLRKVLRIASMDKKADGQEDSRVVIGRTSYVIEGEWTLRNDHVSDNAF